MPKLVDHEQRRRELISAAHRVVDEGGLDALTVRAIAKEAGYSTGVLAHYFENRAELLLAAFREVFDLAMSRARARLEQAPDDPMKALLGVLAEAMPLDDERRTDTTVWFAFLGLAAGNPELRREGTDRYRLWRALLADAVLAAHPRRISPAEAAGIARRLAATVSGLGVQALFDPEHFGPDELRQELELVVYMEMTAGPT